MFGLEEPMSAQRSVDYSMGAGKITLCNIDYGGLASDVSEESMHSLKTPSMPFENLWFWPTGSEESAVINQRPRPRK